jgi:hypothetical protein
MVGTICVEGGAAVLALAATAALQVLAGYPGTGSIRPSSGGAVARRSARCVAQGSAAALRGVLRASAAALLAAAIAARSKVRRRGLRAEHPGPTPFPSCRDRASSSVRSGAGSPRGCRRSARLPLPRSRSRVRGRVARGPYRWALWQSGSSQASHIRADATQSTLQSFRLSCPGLASCAARDLAGAGFDRVVFSVSGAPAGREALVASPRWPRRCRSRARSALVGTDGGLAAASTPCSAPMDALRRDGGAGGDARHDLTGPAPAGGLHIATRPASRRTDTPTRSPRRGDPARPAVGSGRPGTARRWRRSSVPAAAADWPRAGPPGRRSPRAWAPALLAPGRARPDTLPASTGIARAPAVAAPLPDASATSSSNRARIDARSLGFTPGGLPRRAHRPVRPSRDRVPRDQARRDANALACCATSADVRNTLILEGPATIRAPPACTAPAATLREVTPIGHDAGVRVPGRAPGARAPRSRHRLCSSWRDGR